MKKKQMKILLFVVYNLMIKYMAYIFFLFKVNNSNMLNLK